MFITQPKFLRFLTNLNSIVLWSQFGCMILLITFNTKMSIFSHTIPFSCLGWYFITVFTQWRLALLLLLSIYYIVDNIDRENLIVFKDNILMPKNLRIFILVIEIDRLKSLRAIYILINKLIFPIAIWLTHRYFIHDAANLLFCVTDSIKAHIEDHTCLVELIAFLTYFEEFVRFV